MQSQEMSSLPSAPKTSHDLENDPLLQPTPFGHSMLQHFPHSATYTNLNTATCGSYPYAVRRRINHLQKEFESRPDLFVEYAQAPLLEEARRGVARILRAQPDNCVFVKNATTGTFTVLQNLEFQQGDVIVYFSTTYGAIENAVMMLQERIPGLQRSRIEYRVPIRSEDLVERFREEVVRLREAGLRPLVAVFDTILSVPGIRFPFEKLVAESRKQEVLSLVDGAHSIGHMRMDLDVLRPDFFVTDCHKWLNVPRGCAVLHVLPEHQHIFRTTIPPSFGYIPKTGPVTLPLWGQQVAGSDDSNGESTTRPSAFQTLFKLVPTSDDTPYLCISTALEFREKVCGGEDGIYSYIYNLAIAGSDRMAEILGTEVLSEPGLQPGEVSEMRQCGIATVRLPLAIVGEGGNDHNQWEGAALPYPPLSEVEGPSVVQYLSKALADGHDTWMPMLELNGWIWVRVCAQVFLEVSDFEWVAGVLKKLCDQVGRREALPRPEAEVRQTQEKKASNMSSTRLFDKDGAFWANYLSGRPQPPDAFYERIFSYHASHGGDFGTVHDVGAGAGVHTAQIAKRFQHVLVSDIEEQNVQAAQRQHGSLPGEPVFHTAKLEDASWIEQESVDLVFAASCINWCDLEMAIEAVDWQLKAGGTLAIAGMGFAALENARAQDVWYRLFQRGVERNYIQKEEKGSVALSALACDASAYDAVPIPERVFDAGALRYRLNFLPGWSWYLAQVPGEREDMVPRLSQVGANDVVKDEEQAGWSFQADMAALRRMAGSFPIWGDGTGFEDLWSELEDIVGAGTVEGVWPAVLILARKRDAVNA